MQQLIACPWFFRKAQYLTGGDKAYLFRLSVKERFLQYWVRSTILPMHLFNYLSGFTLLVARAASKWLHKFPKRKKTKTNNRKNSRGFLLFFNMTIMSYKLSLVWMSRGCYLQLPLRTHAGHLLTWQPIGSPAPLALRLRTDVMVNTRTSFRLFCCPERFFLLQRGNEMKTEGLRILWWYLFLNTIWHTFTLCLFWHFYHFNDRGKNNTKTTTFCTWYSYLQAGRKLDQDAAPLAFHMRCNQIPRLNVPVNVSWFAVSKSTKVAALSIH